MKRLNLNPQPPEEGASTRPPTPEGGFNSSPNNPREADNLQSLESILQNIQKANFIQDDIDKTLREIFSHIKDNSQNTNYKLIKHANYSIYNEQQKELVLSVKNNLILCEINFVKHTIQELFNKELQAKQINLKVNLRFTISYN